PCTRSMCARPGASTTFAYVATYGRRQQARPRALAPGEPRSAAQSSRTTSRNGATSRRGSSRPRRRPRPRWSWARASARRNGCTSRERPPNRQLPPGERDEHHELAVAVERLEVPARTRLGQGAAAHLARAHRAPRLLDLLERRRVAGGRARLHLGAGREPVDDHAQAVGAVASLTEALEPTAAVVRAGRGALLVDPAALLAGVRAALEGRLVDRPHAENEATRRAGAAGAVSRHEVPPQAPAPEGAPRAQARRRPGQCAARPRARPPRWRRSLPTGPPRPSARSLPR